jgi:hypothetical protein
MFRSYPRKTNSSISLLTTGVLERGQVRDPLQHGNCRVRDRLGDRDGLRQRERRVLDTGDHQHGCPHPPQQRALIRPGRHDAANRPAARANVDALHGFADEHDATSG